MSMMKTTTSGRPVLNGTRIRMAEGLSCSTRTPISGYLDEYIAAEIQCMVREIGGWRRCRSVQSQNRRLIDWIEKNAGTFRTRWNGDHQLANG